MMHDSLRPLFVRWPKDRLLHSSFGRRRCRFNEDGRPWHGFAPHRLVLKDHVWALAIRFPARSLAVTEAVYVVRDSNAVSGVNVVVLVDALYVTFPVTARPAESLSV